MMDSSNAIDSDFEIEKNKIDLAIAKAKTNIHTNLTKINEPLTEENILINYDLVSFSYWELKDRIVDTINEYDNCNEISSLTLKQELDKSNTLDSIVINFMIIYGIADTLAVLNYEKSEVTKLLRNIDNAFELIKSNISNNFEHALFFAALTSEIDVDDEALVKYILPKDITLGYKLMKWTFEAYPDMLKSIETAYSTGFITENSNIRTQLKELIKLNSCSNNNVDNYSINLQIEY